MRADQPLANIWTWAALTWVYALRASFEKVLAPFVRSLPSGPPNAVAMLLFVTFLLKGEAYLEKTIRNAAANALGLPVDRRHWRAFLRPMPRNGFRTLIACLRRHERLLRDPERAIRRRIARMIRALDAKPLADLRADAAALALRASAFQISELAAPAALAVLTPLAARPP